MRPEDARFLRRVAIMMAMFFLYAVVAIVASLVSSCAHKPDGVRIPEPIGGAVANALGEATGVRPDAITIPGVPPIFLTPDPTGCVAAHEAVHVQQQRRDGKARWTAEYAGAFWACMSPVPMEERRANWDRCYRSLPAEVEAYAVEDACRGGR